jgi:hypothetical protein
MERLGRYFFGSRAKNKKKHILIFPPQIPILFGSRAKNKNNMEFFIMARERKKKKSSPKR